MAEAKTKETKASVKDFLDRVANERRRKDSQVLVRMMKKATGNTPKMWGPSIVGFGRHRYEYASGRSGEWPLIAFSPRKQDLTLYVIVPGFKEQAALLKKLGPHRTGVSCLYLKKLDDVDMTVLGRLIDVTAAYMKKKHA